MKIFAALVAAFLICGCALRPISTMAIVLVPETTRGVPPEQVARARASLEADLTRWGQVVTRFVKDADYWVHASYVPSPRDPGQGYLFVLRRERNPMKERIPPHDTLNVRPAITDVISGGPMPGAP